MLTPSARHDAVCAESDRHNDFQTRNGLVGGTSWNRLREHLRVLGASELSPLKNSLQPAFHDWQSLNDDLLGGLDFLLAEMGARHPDHRIQTRRDGLRRRSAA